MRHRILLMAMAALGLVGAAVVVADDTQEAVPAAYAPFEHMIGGWKGSGIPAKNPLKGWPEKHMWSWKFVKGKPVGMTLEMTGSKVLGKAALSLDAKTEDYHLDGLDADGRPIKFAGKLDDNGILHLEMLDPPADLGKEKIDIVLNQNKIRYTMRIYRQEPGAPQYASFITTNLGKEGESFAAGGAAADLPKCIVTGGAGTMTVSFQGKSFPICCSGCRDEFTENPEKYVKKFLARGGKAEAAAPPVEAAPAEKTIASPKAMPKMESAKTKTPEVPKAETKPAVEKNDGAGKAASLLGQASALEKAGKTAAALTYYKRVAKEYPDTPSAKTANTKIKALNK